MNRLRPNELKQKAQVLSRNHRDSQQRTVLLYTGVTVAVTIAASALQFLLEEGISGTGGLGGLGLRSVLQTVQAVLSYALSLFSPFWFGGFLFSILLLADDRDPEPKDLLAGFRRFAPLLSCYLWRLGIGILVCLVVLHISSTIFALSPFSNDLVVALEPYLADPTLLESADLTAYLPLMTPALVIFLVIALPILIFLEYGMRLAPYLIMADSRFRGLSSILASFSAMRGHKWGMVRLDLSWWWFYALEGLLTVVCYLDVLLPMVGITLPINATVAYFVTLILYGILELVLHLWKKADFEISFALAYRQITDPLLFPPKEPEAPEQEA